MWLSHETAKGTLYEECMADTETLEAIIPFIETSLKKYKKELKRRKELKI